MNSWSFMGAYKKRLRISFIPVVIVCAAVIGLLAYSAVTYNNNTNNPMILNTDADFRDAAENKKYVQLSVDSDSIYDPGIVKEETTQRRGRKSTSVRNIIFVSIQGKVAAISIPASKYEEIFKQETGPYVFAGTVSNFESDELTEIKSMLLADGVTREQLDAMLYKQYIKYETPLQTVMLYILIAAGILIFILAVFIPPFLKNKKALKSLKDYSNNDLQLVCNKIDNEAAMPNVLSRGPITITQNYIIAQSRQIVFALPIRELMWVYKKVITNKTYGITVGKTNSLVFVFSDKKSHVVEIPKHYTDGMDELLVYIAQTYPTVMVGFSQERANMLQKNANEFVRQWKNNVNAAMYQ